MAYFKYGLAVTVNNFIIKTQYFIDDDFNFYKMLVTIALGSFLDVITENYQSEKKDLVFNSSKENVNKDNNINNDNYNNIKNIHDLSERIRCLSSRIEEQNYELITRMNKMNDTLSARMDRICDCDKLRNEFDKFRSFVFVILILIILGMILF